jgi:hypothetical protein
MIKSTVRGQARQIGYVGRNLTTHWTEARVSRSFIVSLLVSALSARSVNSGVKCCVAGDSLNLLTMCLAARAIEWQSKLNGLTRPVLSMLNGNARPATWDVRLRRNYGASSNK